ncbi:hypothetical protein B0H19DRAFT_1250636 [Mycena capillaripes]|nr:hypothetical protein B0H19DRAFT_1250636 [Mycena capillaripes]
MTAVRGLCAQWTQCGSALPPILPHPPWTLFVQGSIPEGHLLARSNLGSIAIIVVELRHVSNDFADAVGGIPNYELNELPKNRRKGLCSSHRVRVVHGSVSGAFSLNFLALLLAAAQVLQILAAETIPLCRRFSFFSKVHVISGPKMPSISLPPFKLSTSSPTARAAPATSPPRPYLIRSRAGPCPVVPARGGAAVCDTCRPRRSCLRVSAVACASGWLRIYTHLRLLHPPFCRTRAFVATLSSIAFVALRVYVHGRRPSAISPSYSVPHVVAASIHASPPSASPSCSRRPEQQRAAVYKPPSPQPSCSVSGAPTSLHDTSQPAGLA